MNIEDQKIKIDINAVSPFITIIIPVFNAENYLNQCLGSILDQSYKNFEVICVNDGSTDSSYKILEEYKNRDQKFKVLNKANGGPASARNLGLSEAKGKYLWFIDADDWITPNALLTIEQNTQNDLPDIIGFGAFTFHNKTKKLKLDNYRDLSLIPKDHIDKLQSLETGYNYLFDLPVEAWSRVFNLAFIKGNNIIFDERVWGIDDGVFVAEAFIKSTRIKHIKESLYYYRIANKNSVVFLLKGVGQKTYRSSVYFSEKCDEIIENSELPIELFEGLIDRNLMRMAYYLNRAKFYSSYKIYNEIKTYLNQSEILNRQFLKTKERYQLFYNIKTESYFLYILKNFIFKKTFKVCRYYKKISIFGIEIFRKSKKTVNNVEIKNIRIIGIRIYKAETKIV